MYVLSEKQQLSVLTLLTEGSSISSTARYTGIHRDTCTRLMSRFASACQAFIDRELRDLQLKHMEIDETWTFCRKKKRNVTGKEPDADRIGEFYLFVALDEETRLVPAHLVGKRDEATTFAFMTDLFSRLKKPQPKIIRQNGIFKLAPISPIVRISTDAFPAYADIIKSVFGPYATYAQIKKHVQDKKTKAKTNKDLFITKKVFQGEIDEKDISTSLIERNNLTTRTFMRRFARKSLGFSKKLENLQAATTIHFTYYNYCWKIKTFKTTPAVQAGIAKDCWTVADLYSHLRERYPHLLSFSGVDAA